MSYKDFTYQQQCVILRHYKELSYNKLGEMLNLSPQDICAFIRNEGLRKAKMRQPNIWTEQEISFLKENFNIYSRRILAKKLNKTEANIRAKIKELNLVSEGQRKNYIVIDGKERKRKVKLTKEQEDFLKNNYNKLSNNDLSKILNISSQDVYNYATNILKLQNFGHTTNKGFNFYELQTLKEFYGALPPRELCKLLPTKTWKQIERKAKSMKLASVKMTYPEEKIKEILNKNNVSYLVQQRHYFGEKLYIADFEIKNIVIEVQGDYWHGNPKRYNENELNDLQKKMISRDLDKKQCFEKEGYIVYCVWELDLHLILNECEKKLISFISENIKE